MSNGLLPYAAAQLIDPAMARALHADISGWQSLRRWAGGRQRIND
jgi:hypothetical protein